MAELKLILFVSVLLSLQPVSKKKKEKERCSLLVEKLKDEFKQQEEHNQRVMASLKHERDSWLPASKCILALFLEQSEINFWKGVFCSLEFRLDQTLKLFKKLWCADFCYSFQPTRDKSKITRDLAIACFPALFTLSADWLIA